MVLAHQARTPNSLLSSSVPYFSLDLVEETEKMRIKKIIDIDGLTLLIYYTNAHCWQFAVIGENAKLWQSNQIFYTKEAAEVEGRMFIGYNF